ncbi:MAG: GIY-YIG nuclease family protein [Candidatus Portnoybacteria bacterium]|nr:GIY-YIG nuclease family protein [Candidatus Portnoybacteria bacterium]
MYYVYILFSKKLNKRYIGSTNDLRQRLIYHNNGKSPYTSKGIPWLLVYYEAFTLKRDSLKEERFLKTGKGRERIKYLFSNSGRVA